MEADDQNTMESTSEAVGTSSKPDNVESSTHGNLGEGTSSQVASHSAEAGPEEKTPSKRNYRRRTGQSENESSSDDDPATAPAVNRPTADEAQPPPQQPDEASDVSLDELRVSNSDEDRDHNSGR